MSVFSKALERWRVVGHPTSKVYFDGPITIRPSHITDIENALTRSNGYARVRLFVNQREIDMSGQYGYSPSVLEAVQQSRTYEDVRSISIQSEDVKVFLSRAASAASASADATSQGELWKVRKIFQSATWGFGGYLFRTWGSGIAVTVAFLIAMYGFDVQPMSSRSVATTSILIALVLYLGITVFVGLARRVRFDLRQIGDKRRVGIDLFLQGIAIPIIGLILNSFWPLLTSWWSDLVASLSY